MKKIIFLDIDGVLVTRKSLSESKKSGLRASFDKNAVNNLNLITKMTGADFVISSTWRFLKTKQELETKFKESGIHGNIFDVTPDLCKSRGTEIRAWIDKNNEIVDKILVIDDTMDISPFENVFVHTDTFEGLTYNDALKSIDILEG